jgi:hypothetical protein
MSEIGSMRGPMADKESLQVIGLILGGITAGIIVIAATLVHASASGRLLDRRATSQVEQIAGFHRVMAQSGGTTAGSP